MQRCLDLARHGWPHVAPNPMVGCVIAVGDRILAEGFHRKVGGPHAEIHALDAVSEADRPLLPEATLYVNLEPCAHHGRTPPCSDRIVREGVGRVVVAMTDPHEQVAGRGIDRIRRAGIDVVTGVCEGEARRLNRRFVVNHEAHRPYIVLKWARSADGFFAPIEPRQQWITGPESRQLVHRWRSEEAGIAVGANTVRIDDPALTNRLWHGRSPLRLVIDRDGDLATSEASVLADGNPTVVYTSEAPATDRGPHVETVVVPRPGFLEAVVADWSGRDLASVMVEGGRDLLNAFIAADLWDEARILTGPDALGEGRAAPHIHGALIDEAAIGRDRLHIHERSAR